MMEWLSDRTDQGQDGLPCIKGSEGDGEAKEDGNSVDSKGKLNGQDGNGIEIEMAEKAANGNE